jgi:hypothetical protein
VIEEIGAPRRATDMSAVVSADSAPAAPWLGSVADTAIGRGAASSDPDRVSGSPQAARTSAAPMAIAAADIIGLRRFERLVRRFAMVQSEVAGVVVTAM